MIARRAGAADDRAVSGQPVQPPRHAAHLRRVRRARSELEVSPDAMVDMTAAEPTRRARPQDHALHARAQLSAAGAASCRAPPLCLRRRPRSLRGLLWSLGLALLLPPLVCRRRCWFSAAVRRALTQDTRAYKVWWFILSVAGRVQPAAVDRGDFAAHARTLCAVDFPVGRPASPLVYWAPGSSRRPSAVIVGAGAVIGVGAGLVGHAGTIAAGRNLPHRHRALARRPRRR